MRQHTILLVLLTFISGIILVNKSKIDLNKAEANGLYTLLKEPPKSGSPEDYDVYDNLAFIAYIVSNSKSFDTTTDGNVEALGGIYSQKVKNTRIVNGENAFTEAITTSAFVKRYEQKFFSDDKILVRNEDSVDKSGNINWKNEVTAISKETYESLYGWYPTWLIGYIVHPESILNASMEKQNDQYVIRCEMNVNIAPAYNQYEMKTYAGATETPSFESITLTFTFDSNWILKTVLENSVYNVCIPGLDWLKCSGTLLETFNFRDTEIPDLDFFLSNIDKEISDLDKKMDVATYLQNAFGKYIVDTELNLNGNINIFDKNMPIDISANITDLSNLRIKALSNDLFISYENSNVYIKFKDEKYMINLSSSISISLDNPLDNAYFEKNDDDVKVFIPINLGDINILATLDLKETDTIILEGISAKITILDFEININLTPSESSIIYPETDQSYKELQINWLINKFEEIISYDGFGIDINTSINLQGQALDIYGKITILNNLASGIITISNNLNEYNLYLYYDKYLYLEIENLRFKIDIPDFIDNLPNITSLIKDLVNNISFNDLNLKIDSNDDLFKLLINDYELSIYNNEKLDISLNNINLSIYEINELINYDIKDDYILISNFNKLNEIIDLFKNDKNINILFTSNIKISNIAVDLSAEITTSPGFSNLYGELKINALGSQNVIKFNILDGNVIINYGNIFVKLNKDEILSIIKNFDNSSLDVTGILNLLPDLSITDNSIKLNNFSISNMKLNLTNTDSEIKALTYDECLDFDSINNLFDYIEGFKNLNREQIYITLNSTLKDNNEIKYNITSTIKILNSEKLSAEIDLLVSPTYEIKENVSAYGYVDIKLILIDDYVYVNFNNVLMKASLSNLKDLLKTVLDIVNIDIKLDEIIDVSNFQNNIDYLLDLIKNKVNLSSFDLSTLINNIEINENYLNLKINQNNNIIDINLYKDIQEIKSLSINNISISETEILDLDFEILNKDLTIKYPDNIDSYNDFSSINQFVSDLYNTANMKNYELDGSAEISLLGILKPTITFNLRVALNSDSSINDISLMVKTPALATNKPLSGVDCVSNIYYSDNTIYIKRTTAKNIFNIGAGKLTTYTKASIDDFLNNILDYVYYITDLSDSIKNQINTGSSSDNTIIRTFEKAFKSYSYQDSTYNLNLNLGNIIESDLLGNINLNIKRNDNGYLTNLSGSLDKLAVSLITAKFNINNKLENINSPKQNEVYSDTLLDFESLNGYITI